MTNPFDRSDGAPPEFVDLRCPTPDGQDGGSGALDGCSASDGSGGAGAPTGRRGRRRRPQRKGAEPPTDPKSAAAQDSSLESDPEDVARAIVLRQLTMAPRSRQQLFDKLMAKGCQPDVADRVLDRMQQVGLVDDEAYAGSLVRSQQAGRGLARRALRQELRRKGVDDETAGAALDDISDESEKERARELVEKKLRSMHGLEAHVQTRRLAGMLARKGYSSSVAYGVIREAIADAPEHQPD